MDSELLTTGEVAHICGVTPDAVLKWIKKGKLPATRTPGGHYRIMRADCAAVGLEGSGGGETHVVPVDAVDDVGSDVRCWEYFAGRGGLRDVCRECLVYLARAQHCHKLAELGERAGHRRNFCSGNDCSDCPFFRAGHGLATTVLVITSDEGLTRKVARHVDPARVTLRFARSGYEAATSVGAQCPALVVMDSDLAEVRTGALPETMLGDDRIPGIHVVIACREGHESEVADTGLPTVSAPVSAATLEELAAEVARAGRGAPRDVA